MLTPLILTLGFLWSNSGHTPDAARSLHPDFTSACLNLASDFTSDDPIPAPEPANDDSEPESVFERIDGEDDQSDAYVAQFHPTARGDDLSTLTWFRTNRPSNLPAPTRSAPLRC